jgi:hypothetical protein
MWPLLVKILAKPLVLQAHEKHMRNTTMTSCIAAVTSARAKACRRGQCTPNNWRIHTVPMQNSAHNMTCAADDMIIVASAAGHMSLNPYWSIPLAEHSLDTDSLQESGSHQVSCEVLLHQKNQQIGSRPMEV